MTPALIIDRNRKALLRIVAMVFAASGMVAGQPARLPRIIRGTVLFFLRPAESAARRLIFAQAKDVTVSPRASRGAPSKPIPRGKGKRVRAFRLIDPRKRFGGGAGRKFAKVDPRISTFGQGDPVFEAGPDAREISPDEPIDATHLCRRLEALQSALQNLPREARRLARMMARREAARSSAGAPPPLHPIRPGKPPGFRVRGREEIDDVLLECHRLVLMTFEPPDTS